MELKSRHRESGQNSPKSNLIKDQMRLFKLAHASSPTSATLQTHNIAHVSEAKRNGSRTQSHGQPQERRCYLRSGSCSGGGR